MNQVLDGAYEQMVQGNRMLVTSWQHDILFGWRWWVLVSLSVLPWGLIWSVVPGEKRRVLVISGFIAMLLSSFLDVLGLTYDLWRYYVVPFPMMGGFFPWNFSVVPVGMFLVDWLWPKGAPLWKGLLYSLVGAFVAEPLFDWLGFTSHLRWNHVFSVPLYLLIYLLSWYGGRKLILRTSDDLRVGLNGGEVESIHRYAFDHAFDAMYVIETQGGQKNYRFVEVNDAFCELMGYTREELANLDPRLISDQESYNPNVKYRPLMQSGNMNIETILLTKHGEKKYVRLNVKLFENQGKRNILTIARFSEKAVVQDQVT